MGWLVLCVLWAHWRWQLAHLLSSLEVERKPLRGVLEGTSHLHQRFRRLGSLLRRKAAEQAVDFPHAVHATVPAALASDSTCGFLPHISPQHTLHSEKWQGAASRTV